MPATPATIYSPPAGGTAPSAPRVVFAPASGGSPPAAPVVGFVAPSGGSPPAAPVVGFVVGTGGGGATAWQVQVSAPGGATILSGGNLDLAVAACDIANDTAFDALLTVAVESGWDISQISAAIVAALHADPGVMTILNITQQGPVIYMENKVPGAGSLGIPPQLVVNSGSAETFNLYYGTETLTYGQDGSLSAPPAIF